MAGDMDIKAHTETYGNITSLFKWGTVGCAIIAALVIWLIS